MHTRLALFPWVLVGCATLAPGGFDASAIVSAADRTEADRALDPGRRPGPFLSALKLVPGMRVGELIAGGGYTTELLVRAVGPQGVVFAQNPALVLQRFAAKPWAERLARPINRGVVRLDRELDDPFPAEVAGTLDLVVTNANYHDLVWQNVDREKLNRAVLAALKPGGHYAVIDTSAAPGSGLRDVQTLHRIDEATVRAEVEAAGFTLERSEAVLRNPDDPRDWNASPSAAGERRGTGDRFMLIFVKGGR
jgi:predicted methyltransferase